MTTIAYKDGVLACDKQATNNGTRLRAAVKLQVRRNYAYAISGHLAAGLAAVDCIERGESNERPEGKYVVLQMDLQTGKAWEWEDTGNPMPVEDRLWVTGSGGDIALGAMAYGATPEEAVKIAAAWDTDTGFGVQVVRSERAQRRKRS